MEELENIEGARPELDPQNGPEQAQQPEQPEQSPVQEPDASPEPVGEPEPESDPEPVEEPGEQPDLEPPPVQEPEPDPESEPEPERPQHSVVVMDTVLADDLLVEDGASSSEIQAAEEEGQLRAVVEALVYVAEEPITVAQLAASLQQTAERIREVLNQLIAEFDKPEHGFCIREVAGGYRMATKPEHHDAVRAFAKSLKAPLKLSLPALETLAVIAYKQPVTAPEIKEIRGVQGTGVLNTLLDRKLIAEAGRKNVIGKPILYKTTKEFLIQFGLKDLAELPTLKEFEEIRRMAMPDESSETASAAPESVAVVRAAAVAPEAAHRQPAAETADSEPAESGQSAEAQSDTEAAVAAPEAADLQPAAETADSEPAESGQSAEAQTEDEAAAAAPEAAHLQPAAETADSEPAESGQSAEAQTEDEAAAAAPEAADLQPAAETADSEPAESGQSAEAQTEDEAAAAAPEAAHLQPAAETADSEPAESGQSAEAQSDTEAAVAEPEAAHRQPAAETADSEPAESGQSAEAQSDTEAAVAEPEAADEPPTAKPEQPVGPPAAVDDAEGRIENPPQDAILPHKDTGPQAEAVAPVDDAKVQTED